MLIRSLRVLARFNAPPNWDASAFVIGYLYKEAHGYRRVAGLIGADLLGAGSKSRSTLD
jgi:hypothetical protein